LGGKRYIDIFHSIPWDCGMERHGNGDFPFSIGKDAIGRQL
jgi:hypothetical protein